MTRDSSVHFQDRESHKPRNPRVCGHLYYFVRIPIFIIPGKYYLGHRLDVSVPLYNIDFCLK